MLNYSIPDDEKTFRASFDMVQSVMGCAPKTENGSLRVSFSKPLLGAQMTCHGQCSWYALWQFMWSESLSSVVVRIQFGLLLHWFFSK